MEPFDLIEELKKHNVLPDKRILPKTYVLDYIKSLLCESEEFTIHLDISAKEVVDGDVVVTYNSITDHITNESFLCNVKFGLTSWSSTCWPLDEIVPWVYVGERDGEYYRHLWHEDEFVYHNQRLVVGCLGNVTFCSKIEDLPEVPLTESPRESDYEGGIAPEKLLEYLRYWNK